MRSARGVWLSHYAHRAWPHMHRGDVHLYGHSHGSLPAIERSLDVGVDCWGWTTATLPQILTRLEELGLAGTERELKVERAAGRRDQIYEAVRT